MEKKLSRAAIATLEVADKVGQSDIPRGMNPSTRDRGEMIQRSNATVDALLANMAETPVTLVDGVERYSLNVLAAETSPATMLQLATSLGVSDAPSPRVGAFPFKMGASPDGIVGPLLFAVPVSIGRQVITALFKVIGVVAGLISKLLLSVSRVMSRGPCTRLFTVGSSVNSTVGATLFRVLKGQGITAFPTPQAGTLRRRYQRLEPLYTFRRDAEAT